jgi:hypothetical protein
MYAGRADIANDANCAGPPPLRALIHSSFALSSAFNPINTKLVVIHSPCGAF